MHDTVNPLILELLTWISNRPRTYEHAMEVWRSTCPRHSVWEDALMDGFIQIAKSGDTMDQSRVMLTDVGRAVLERNTDLTRRA